MTTAEELLAEDGAVLVPRSLTSTTFAALLLYLQDRVQANGGDLTPDARALLHALNRAATHTVSPTKPAGDDPANVMLGMGKVAALMGCTPQWARRLAARGAIPGAQRFGRIWLVPSTSLEAFRHEREEAPGGEAGEDGDRGRRAEEQGAGPAA